MEFKYINMCGLEIEAGWNYQRPELVEDAGIRAADFPESVCCGEFVSKPMDNWDDVEKTIRKNWEGLQTHQMAGYHQHYSFKNISSYVALMNPKFRKYFKEYMRKWGEEYPINNPHFWDRLEDKNKFCKDIFEPDTQIQLKKKVPNDHGRYSQLNYCFGLHKTLECRLLPTFIHVESAVSGTAAVINCFESYLKENPPGEFIFKHETTCEEKAFEELFFDSSKPSPIKPFNLFAEKGLISGGRIPTLAELDARIKKKVPALPKKSLGNNMVIADGRPSKQED